MNYTFLVKSNSDGMEYFEEYNDDEENRILPLLGDKIVLECWCKWFKNKYFTENINLERVVSIESWDSPQCSTNVIGAFQGYIGKGMKQKNLFYISPFSNNWIHIFAPKPMTIVNFNFILCSIFIIKNWNASLLIVIGFGAKIWIQLLEKGEI